MVQERPDLFKSKVSRRQSVKRAPSSAVACDSARPDERMQAAAAPAAGLEDWPSRVALVWGLSARRHSDVVLHDGDGDRPFNDSFYSLLCVPNHV